LVAENTIPEWIAYRELFCSRLVSAVRFLEGQALHPYVPTMLNECFLVITAIQQLWDPGRVALLL
jgi:hypothetical protein